MGAARAALSEASRALLSDSRVRTPTSTVRCNTFVVHVDDDVAELEFEVRGVPEARDERRPSIRDMDANVKIGAH